MQRFALRDLAEAHYEVGFCLRNLRHPDCAVQAAGDMYDSLSDARRTAGLLELLLNADEKAVAAQLAHSGYARRNYLARCAEASFFDYHVCASNSNALFDALAVGQVAIACDLAALSPTAVRPNEEYEDDFCYGPFLHGYISQNSRRTDRLFERFERALEGGSSARLAVCKAFATQDASAFSEAFDDLLDERDEVVAELRLGRAEEEVGAAAECYVFVEGLALLWLAERAGFPTKPDYRYCPAMARSLGSHPPPVDELTPV